MRGNRLFSADVNKAEPIEAQALKNLMLILTTFPYFYGIGSAYQFAVGPLLYLYVRSIIDKKYKFTLKDLLHFIPFFVIHFNEFPEYFLTNFESYTNYLQGVSSLQNVTIRFMVWHFQPLVYAALLIRLLQHHAGSIKERYPSDGKVNYYWMRNVFYAYGVVWLGKAVVELFMPYEWYIEQAYYIPVSILLTAFHIYIITYLGLNRTEYGREAADNSERYKGSQLSEEKSKAYLQQLLRNMEEEKSFTDPKLTLPSLAGRLSINSRYLSQVINENLGQNFYDFINGYRIDEAKKQLTDPGKKNYTIEAIAFEVGFNSKAAFYSTFKKQTHMTPSQFREMHDAATAKISAHGSN